MRSWHVDLRSGILEGRGVDECWDSIEEHHRVLDGAGMLQQRRAEQAKAWMWGELSTGLLERLQLDPAAAEAAARLEADVEAGRIPPTVAASQVLDAFHG